MRRRMKLRQSGTCLESALFSNPSSPSQRLPQRLPLQTFLWEILEKGEREESRWFLRRFPVDDQKDCGAESDQILRCDVFFVADGQTIDRCPVFGAEVFNFDFSIFGDGQPGVVSR